MCAVLPNSVDAPLFGRAANYTGRLVRPVPPVNPPGRIAVWIARLLDSPRRQSYAGRGAASLGWQWWLAPVWTEWFMTWYGERVQFVADVTAPATTSRRRTTAR